MQFATAKNLNRLWKVFKSRLSASDKRLSVLERLFIVQDPGEDLMSLTDSEGMVLASVGHDGRVRFEVGLESPEGTLEKATVRKVLSVEGDVEVGGGPGGSGSVMSESDDRDLFYIIDSEHRILFSIDFEGNTHFKGVPEQIREEMDVLKSRIGELEREVSSLRSDHDPEEEPGEESV